MDWCGTSSWPGNVLLDLTTFWNPYSKNHCSTNEVKDTKYDAEIGIKLGDTDNAADLNDLRLYLKEEDDEIDNECEISLIPR
jgi:hypothetical protein